MAVMASKSLTFIYMHLLTALRLMALTSLFHPMSAFFTLPSIRTGDDCVAVKSGSSYISITHVVCGPGHGISVGSLGVDGANSTVEEVHVSDCSFIGTKNGARIKTWRGAGLGYAKAISFEHITLVESKNPIIIDQNYCNPKNRCNPRVGLKVSDVRFRSIRGTSASEEAITLNCAKFGCSNVLMFNVHFFPAQPGKSLRSFYKNALGYSSFTTLLPSLNISNPYKTTT